MKEKLQYVEKENSSLETGLTDLDTSMIAQRDSLTQLKATRDALRTKGRTIKASSVYVTSAPLLADLEVGGGRCCVPMRMKETGHEMTLE